jgi:hypothetical protein
VKILIATDEIPRIGHILSVLGAEPTFTVSVPQGNKYHPHQGKKEKMRRLKQLAKTDEAENQ